MTEKQVLNLKIKAKEKSKSNGLFDYSSNIILISSKQDDDSKENPVVTEFNKLMMNSQILS